MSILDFLKGVFRLFIDNFPKFVSRLWDKVPADMKPIIKGLEAAVNVIKDAANSPLADALVALTKTTLDDKALAWVRETAPIVLRELRLLQGDDEKISFSDDPVIRAFQLHSITGALNSKLTGSIPDQAAITTSVSYQNR